MKALRVLEAEWHITLPQPQRMPRSFGPRLLEAPVPEAVDVPADVRQIKDLKVAVVERAEDVRFGTR